MYLLIDILYQEGVLKSSGHTLLLIVEMQKVCKDMSCTHKLL